MDILSVVTRVPILFFGVERNDDDFADRINYKYTVAVLIIFAIIVTNRQFGTKQIHCWIPAYFTRNYEEYINDICWVSNTYYISLDQKLPEAEQIRKSFELKYYQWVPFILLSQAFFFYIPHLAWRALSRRSGIDIRDIVEAASNYKSVDKYENRQKYMSYMLTAVDQYVDDPRRRKETRRSLLIKRLVSGICCISGKFLGNYLMVLYLFIKLAFISNCISQLFVLNLLLGHEFHKFGFELLDKILNGKGWDTGSRIFPKISMCDFRIREVGNPKVSHRYTVQCVLPINLFNQQIFTFIWFWYGIVLIVNIYSLCVWTYRFLPAKRLRYISRRIEIMRQALFWRNKQSLNFEQMPDLEMHAFEKDLIRHFVHDYLESDGLFILRVLSSNTSDFVCTELIQELWKYYRKQRKFNRTSDEEDEDDELNDDDDDDNETRSLDYKKNMDEEKMEKAAIRHRPRPPANLHHPKSNEHESKTNNHSERQQQHLMINHTDSEDDKSNLEEESHAEGGGTTHDEDDEHSDNENQHHNSRYHPHHNHHDNEDYGSGETRHPHLKKPGAKTQQAVDPRVNLAKKVVSKMPLSEQISNVYHKPKKPDISSLPAAAAQASSKVFQLDKQLHQHDEQQQGVLEENHHHQDDNNTPDQQQQANNNKPKRPVTLNSQSSVLISNYPNAPPPPTLSSSLTSPTSKLLNASSHSSSSPGPATNSVESQEKNKPNKSSSGGGGGKAPSGSSSNSSSSSANISPTSQPANAKSKNNKFLETET